MIYHETKDRYYVKLKLGHKNIKNTLLYVQLEKALFQGEIDERFNTRPATNLAIAYTFDIEEEKIAKDTEKQVNADTQFSHITVSHLRNTSWNIGCYSSGVEPLYQGKK